MYMKTRRKLPRMHKLNCHQGSLHHFAKSYNFCHWLKHNLTSGSKKSVNSCVEKGIWLRLVFISIVSAGHFHLLLVPTDQFQVVCGRHIVVALHFRVHFQREVGHRLVHDGENLGQMGLVVVLDAKHEQNNL